MKIKIQLNKTSCLRARNIVKDHGDIFEIKNRHDNVYCLGGVAGTLLKAEDGWVGWFFDHEFTIIEKYQ